MPITSLADLNGGFARRGMDPHVKRQVTVGSDPTCHVIFFSRLSSSSSLFSSSLTLPGVAPTTAPGLSHGHALVILQLTHGMAVSAASSTLTHQPALLDYVAFSSPSPHARPAPPFWIPRHLCPLHPVMPYLAVPTSGSGGGEGGNGSNEEEEEARAAEDRAGGFTGFLF